MAGSKEAINTGNTVYQPNKIANAFQRYYSDLYNLASDHNTPQHNDLIINSFLDSVNLPKLNKETLESLNSPILEK